MINLYGMKINLLYWNIQCTKLNNNNNNKIIFKGGTAYIESRGLKESDWEDDLFDFNRGSCESSSGDGDDKHSNSSNKNSKYVDNVSDKKIPSNKIDINKSNNNENVNNKNKKNNINNKNDNSINNDDLEMRKTILNAPKRIKKIENMLEKYNEELKIIDENMIQVYFFY